MATDWKSENNLVPRTGNLSIVMILPHSTPSLTRLPNGWLQVSFTLTVPFVLEIGSRLRMGTTRFAPWRVDGQKVDCLCLPHEGEPDVSQPITLEQQGKPLAPIEANRPLLITGENLGIADALFAAHHLKQDAAHCLVLLAGESFPCTIKPARFMVPSFPDLIAACPLLEDWGFANRLASTTGLAGCFEGNLTQLLQQINNTTTIKWQMI
jgi:hypothetical protein